MDLYSLLREFADSWMLLLMFLFFAGCIIWVFRPGSRSAHRDSANIPFRHEDAPLTSPRNDQKEEETA